MNENMDRLLPRSRVLELTGLSATQLGEAVRNGSFPRPVRVGAHPDKRRKAAWVAGEVAAWIRERINERDNLDHRQPAA